MSADYDTSLDAAALLRLADQTTACACFHVVEGGSRHFCESCQMSLSAHIIVAQRALAAQCCGTCEHSNDAETIHDAETHCTKASGYYNGKLMQMSARCAAWEARRDA